MQKWFSNIQVLLLFLFSISMVQAMEEKNLLLQADSLYQKKKFSEAQKLYLKLYQQGFSSPATLLKMAFVNEGLGQTANALFFLSAYYKQTEDPKTYDKIQVLANALNLSGYEQTDFNRLIIWLSNRVDLTILLITSACLVSMLLMLYCRKRNMINGKMVAGFFSLFFLLALFLTTNFVEHPAQAVIARQTYFMNGPSAGANFLGMINDGNQVALAGEHDVWMKIKWNEKEGFVKKADLLFYN